MQGHYYQNSSNHNPQQIPSNQQHYNQSHQQNVHLSQHPQPPQTYKKPSNIAPPQNMSSSFKPRLSNKAMTKSKIKSRHHADYCPPIKETVAKQILTEDLEKVQHACRSKKIALTDPTFPPNNTSFYGDAKPEDVNQKWAKDFKWLPITEIFKGEKIQIYDNIDPVNIIQAHLGNCYFLSALSSMAERPALIRRLFDTDRINSQGIFAVW